MADPKRIRITHKVPAGDGHGIRVGREFKVLPRPGNDKGGGIWVMGDLAEPVRVYSREYERLDG